MPGAGAAEGGRVTHGTVYEYRYKECRCEACETAYREQSRRKRAREKARKDGTLIFTPRGTPGGQLKSHRGEGCIVSLKHRETGKTKTFHNPGATPLGALKDALVPFSGEEWQVQAVSTIQTVWSDLRMHTASSRLRSAEQHLLGKVGRTDLL